MSGVNGMNGGRSSAAPAGKTASVDTKSSYPARVPHLPTGMTSRHSSESVEHYTPDAVVLRARNALGYVDLDPASTAKANETIRATKFYTKEENGFRKEWHGLTFLNPPGGLSDNLERPVKPKCRQTGSCGLTGSLQDGVGHTHEGSESNQRKWWFKFACEFTSGRVPSGIFIMFSVELLQMCQTPGRAGLLSGDEVKHLPIPLDGAICFPRQRLKFKRPDGTVGSQPPHSSGIVLLSRQKIVIERFVEEYSTLGRVIVGAMTREMLK